MHVYKLKYNNKQEALNDLMKKGIIKDKTIRESSYMKNTLAVVDVGKIIDQPAKYDENENLIKEATYIDGYHIDLMLREPKTFKNEITTQNPVHLFA